MESVRGGHSEGGGDDGWDIVRVEGMMGGV